LSKLQSTHQTKQEQKGKIMARYVTLLRFTDEGARALGKSPARAQSFREAVEKDGLKVEAQLWTAGSRDGVLILSGDEGKILHRLAQLAAEGNVRTESMRAFDAGEFKGIAG
jgi:uncharacterized protein with GYD domain